MTAAKRDAFFANFAQSPNGRANLEAALLEAERSVDQTNNDLALFSSDPTCYGDNPHERQPHLQRLLKNRDALLESISIFRRALANSAENLAPSESIHP